MRYKSKRLYSWDSNTAYACGLITSDGCLSSDKRHIDLTSKDTEQLVNFNKAIGKNIPISPKNNKNGQTAWRIQFSDVAFYDFLSSSGLTPKKSKTVSKINVPNEFYYDFLRGVFDGDGSVYGYYDNRWKNSFMFYVTIYSASYLFLQEIQKNNIERLNIQGSLTKASKCHRLQYAKKESTLLFEHFYFKTDTIKLTRKYETFKKFISIDKNVNMS